MDLFVSNDTVPNFLFVNRGKGGLSRIGLLAGVGYNSFGRARSGMGVDAADYDQDGWMDLFVSNVDRKCFRCITTTKTGRFTDVAPRPASPLPRDCMSGWGLKFFDYDNDGEMDLLLCNGHPDTDGAE